MTAEQACNWYVTVLDREMNVIGRVSISRIENRGFTRRRLWDLIGVTDDVEERADMEFTPIEFWDDRKARLDRYDEAIIRGFRSAFPFDDVDGLFTRYRPTDTVNGRAYYLILLEGILMGFEAALEHHTDETLIQIDA